MLRRRRREITNRISASPPATRAHARASIGTLLIGEPCPSCLSTAPEDNSITGEGWQELRPRSDRRVPVGLSSVCTSRFEPLSYMLGAPRRRGPAPRLQQGLRSL